MPKENLDHINKRRWDRPNGSPKVCGTCKFLFEDRCPKRKKVHAAQDVKEIEYHPPSLAVDNYIEEHDEEMSEEQARQNLKEEKVENLANKHNISKDVARQYLEEQPNPNDVLITGEPNPCNLYKYRGRWSPDPKYRGINITKAKPEDRGDKEEADYECIGCGRYLKKEELDSMTGHCPYCDGKSLKKIHSKTKKTKAR